MIAFAFQAAAAFNLVCSINVTINNGPAQTQTQAFRVDLQAMRFCIDECQETEPIVRASNSEILLDDTTGVRAGSHFYRVLSRESGRIVERIVMPMTAANGSTVVMEMLETGHCDPAPFTGFPAQRF